MTFEKNNNAQNSISNGNQLYNRILPTTTIVTPATVMTTTLMLSNGTIAEGAVSVSLNDSWTGRQLLDALSHVPPVRFSAEEFDVNGDECVCV